MSTWRNLNRKRFLRIHGFNRNRRLYIGKDKIKEFVDTLSQLQVKATISVGALNNLSDAAASVFSSSQNFLLNKELLAKYIEKNYGGAIICVRK